MAVCSFEGWDSIVREPFTFTSMGMLESPSADSKMIFFALLPVTLDTAKQVLRVYGVEFLAIPKMSKTGVLASKLFALIIQNCKSSESLVMVIFLDRH